MCEVGGGREDRGYWEEPEEGFDRGASVFGDCEHGVE